MNELYAIVEGPTEQSFIRDCLAVFLSEHEQYLSPVLIGRTGHKGGNVTFERFVQNAGALFKQRDSTIVTSMLDYFRLDSKWPGMADIQAKQQSLGGKIGKLEIEKILVESTLTALRESFPELDVANRFVPYFSMHEFEALLFSDISILASNLDVPESGLKSVLAKYADDPEEINTLTAPSKILLKQKPSYKKIVDGNTIVRKIGMDTLRARCSCFNDWVSALLNISFPISS
ncbi:MAG: DUF4276 family protein [Spirochaetia bacterium]|jgi:hypothetical protein|nr:DUF4276 family protein [Spirochaetia bacterium]